MIILQAQRGIYKCLGGIKAECDKGQLLKLNAEPLLTQFFENKMNYYKELV